MPKLNLENILFGNISAVALHVQLPPEAVL